MFRFFFVYCVHFFNTNESSSFTSFTPKATKVHRILSSVVHYLALGHNIFLSGQRTTHLLGNTTFEIKKFG